MKLKYGILLLFAAGVLSSEVFAAESAIIRSNYTGNYANKHIRNTEYRSNADSGALYDVKHIRAGIQELQQEIQAEPDNYNLYSDLVYALLKAKIYNEALDNLIYLNSLDKKGALDKEAVSSLKQIYGAYKRTGRKDSGLNLNLAVLSKIVKDGNEAVYLSEGASASKNKELVKKAMRSVYDGSADYPAVINDCIKIAAKNPENTEIKKIKAENHLKIKQMKEAEKEYSEILAIDNSDDNSRYELYKLLAASRNIDEKLMVKKLYGASPSFTYEKGYVSITELLMKHKNYKAAKAFASSMMKKYPQNPNGYLYKAEILKQEGNVKEAYDVLSFARNKADSMETAAKYNVLLAKLSDEPVKEADSLIENGLYEQAVQVLDGANPASFYVILTQAKANYYAGNKEKAFEHLNRAMSLFPDNSEVYCAFAAVYYKEKDNETAKNYVSRALKIDPENKTAQQLLDLINKAEADSYNTRILDEMELQNYTEAMRLTEEALEIDNKSADLYYFKGLIHIAQNNYDASADALQECIRLNKNYIDAYFYFAASLDNLSAKDSALENYKTFLNLARGNELGRTERIEYARLRISKLEK